MNLLTLLVCICLIFFKASATEVVMHRMDIQRTGIILDAKGPTNPELKWKYGCVGEPNLLLTKGRLCFADKSEHLHLVDIQTGQAIWKLAGPIGTPSIAKDSKLYVATAKQMICVDLESQKILWQFPKNGSIEFYTERDIRKNEIWGRVGDGLILDGISIQGESKDLLLCCAFAKVFALDRHTGALIWEAPRPCAQATKSLNENDDLGVSALVSDGKLIYGCTNSSMPSDNPDISYFVNQDIWALEVASGKLARTSEGKDWTVQLKGTTNCVGGCMGTLKNGILYWINGGDGVSGHRNKAATFFAIDALSAKILWTNNTDHCAGHCGPLALCDDILLASGTVEEKDRKISYLTAVDIKSQKKIWGYPLNPDPPLKKLRELYNPVIVKNEGRVYFGTGRKEKVEFCCVNLKDGASVWTFTEEGVVGCQGFSRSQPIVAEGRVFFATNGGGIYCLGERIGK